MGALKSARKKVIRKLKSIKYSMNRLYWWLAYRTCNRHHVVKVRDLGPGFHEPSELILHASFQLLVDYVEINLAYSYRVWEEKESIWQKLHYRLPFCLDKLVWNPRSAEAGLKKLEWEINLPREDKLDENGYIVEYSCKHQAEAADKVKRLYLWWTEERPNRPCPSEASGWSDWCKFEKKKYGKLFRTEPCAFKDDGTPSVYRLKDDLTDQEEDEKSKILKRYREIETSYDQEDEDMLKLLAEIRLSLWT